MSDHVVLVSSVEGDWIGLYVNGRLAAEGHSLSERHVLEALGHKVESRQLDMEQADMTRLPEYLKDVPNDIC